MADVQKRATRLIRYEGEKAGSKKGADFSDNKIQGGKGIFPRWFATENAAARERKLQGPTQSIHTKR